MSFMQNKLYIDFFPVTELNKLPGELVKCQTVSNFKRKLDRHPRFSEGFI